ncbi:hypothetical protein [Paraburkholderia rhizosphaerae]|uniref:Uncharacterized protein n=1 Tax=Paraburkholderia rhizosphaerae TaxID=480658 RepID=A0A4R8LWN4_9BURK|nr:hypothetical protein [Paraburkholderia rhizosphaerae]TDY52238.1 hypothetical protein BX592_105122 [Paraburkholderia rhizosphaerae]
MGLLNWLLGRDRVQIAPQIAAQIDDGVNRVLAMYPRLQRASHYKERLKPGVVASLQHIDTLLASLPVAHQADQQAWSSDLALRAFFATPDDLVQAFGRSEELRSFFDQHPDSAEAYAALGMAMKERHFLGVEAEGDQVRYDVPQTSLLFGDHQVRMCSRGERELREEIGHRLFDQLVLEGMAKLATDRDKLLDEARELVQARTTLLERQGVGMRSVVGGEALDDAAELAHLQAQLEENARNLSELRMPTRTYDLQLKGICEVLTAPAAHLYVSSKRIRIDLMNVIRENDGPGCHEIEFHFARIPGDPPRTRAFVLVCFPRREMPAGGLRFDDVMRGLG